MCHNAIATECFHGVAEDVTANGLSKVFSKLWPVTLDPFPLLGGTDAFVGDGFAAELVRFDLRLHIGQPSAGGQGDKQHVMIRWFCILFNNQFTPDDVLDGYPVDRLMHDIALALMAVQTQTTEILDEFPTKAAEEKTPAAKPETES